MPEDIIEDLFSKNSPASKGKEKEDVAKPEFIDLEREEFLPAHKMVLHRWLESIVPNCDLGDTLEEVDLGSILSALAKKLGLEVDSSQTTEALYSGIINKSYGDGQSQLVNQLTLPELAADDSNLEKCRKITYYASQFPGRMDDHLLVIARPNIALERSAPGIIRKRLETASDPELICQGRTSIAEALITESVGPDAVADCVLPGHMTFIIKDSGKIYLADPTEKEPDKQLTVLDQVDLREVERAIEDSGFFEVQILSGETARVLPRNTGLIKAILHLESSIFSTEARQYKHDSPQFKDRYLSSYLANRLGLLLDHNDRKLMIECRDQERVVISIIEN